MTDKKQKSEMLNMSPWDFDQSQNGWRSLEKEGKNIEASNLIKSYIARNREKFALQTTPQKLHVQTLWFHIGQLLAGEGKQYHAEAISAFNRAFLDEAEYWNAYVSATIGFLEGNKEKIKEAISIINNSQQENKEPGNLHIVESLLGALEKGNTDYKSAYVAKHDR